MKHRVLWVEDGAFVHLAELVGPVYRSGKYYLDVAPNASEGLGRIERNQYDVLIVDIRLPPGEEKQWIDVYQAKGHFAETKLGLELLRAILRKDYKRIVVNNWPDWLKPEAIAVFTVDQDVAQEVEDLGIKVFRQKSTSISPRVLLEMIEEVLALR